MVNESNVSMGYRLSGWDWPNKASLHTIGPIADFSPRETAPSNSHGK